MGPMPGKRSIPPSMSDGVRDVASGAHVETFMPAATTSNRSPAYTSRQKCLYSYGLVFGGSGANFGRSNMNDMYMMEFLESDASSNNSSLPVLHNNATTSSPNNSVKEHLDDDPTHTSMDVAESSMQCKWVKVS